VRGRGAWARRSGERGGVGGGDHRARARKVGKSVVAGRRRRRAPASECRARRLHVSRPEAVRRRRARLRGEVAPGRRRRPERVPEGPDCHVGQEGTAAVATPRAAAAARVAVGAVGGGGVGRLFDVERLNDRRLEGRDARALPPAAVSGGSGGATSSGEQRRVLSRTSQSASSAARATAWRSSPAVTDARGPSAAGLR